MVRQILLDVQRNSSVDVTLSHFLKFANLVIVRRWGPVNCQSGPIMFWRILHLGWFLMIYPEYSNFP